MSKHTPGSWTVKPGGTKTSLRIVGTDDYQQDLIAEVPTYGDGVCNARLIAAAPDMLQALERFQKKGPYYNQWTAGDWTVLEAAIAKAKGRE